jgi:hypothetical protein
MTKVENLKPGDWDKANRRRVSSVHRGSCPSSIRIEWNDGSTTWTKAGKHINVDPA